MASAENSGDDASGDAEKASDHHYVYGSGMFGCLYDYGPNFCERESDAIDGLLSLFGEELSETEEKDMVRALQSVGQYNFPRPGDIGADYCEVVRRTGPSPDYDD